MATNDAHSRSAEPDRSVGSVAFPLTTLHCCAPNHTQNTNAQAHQRALTDPAFLALGLPRSPCRFVRGDAEVSHWSPPPSADDHRDPRLKAVADDPLGAATVVFAYSTTWRSDDALHLAPPLHAALLRRLAPSSSSSSSSSSVSSSGRVTVITTDKRLREDFGAGDTKGTGGRGKGFRVVRQLDVPNPEVWESTAYFHEVVGSGAVKCGPLAGV
jgi:hypothetical protein